MRYQVRCKRGIGENWINMPEFAEVITELASVGRGFWLASSRLLNMMQVKGCGGGRGKGKENDQGSSPLREIVEGRISGEEGKRSREIT